MACYNNTRPASLDQIVFTGPILQAYCGYAKQRLMQEYRALDIVEEAHLYERDYKLGTKYSPLMHLTKVLLLGF